MPVPKNYLSQKKYRCMKRLKICIRYTRVANIKRYDYDALGLAEIRYQEYLRDLKYCTGEDVDYVRGFFARRQHKVTSLLGKLIKQI